MIISLVLILLLIIFLAFFIGKNLTNLCTLWIFKTFTELPVSLLVLISFAAGIIFSLLLVLFFKLKTPKQDVKIENEAKSLQKIKEKSIVNKKKNKIQNKKEELENSL